MATTRLLPLHTGKGRSVATALGHSVKYIKNPNKTDNGEWISAYECDPMIADSEFAYSKRQYVELTGRSQGRRNVIAYHLRQSFKPGETDPATANKIGYDLAMSLTKGHHAFIVCTHTDKHHIHSHIIFNSTSLDCTHKFQNFWNSSFVVRRISDQLCLQNGLSVIEAPKSSRGSYGTWLGDNKKPRPSFLRFEGLGGMAILEKLREQSEQTKTEIRQLENRMKRLVQEQSQLVRKERTRRLIERGAILESIIPEAEKLTNEQIKSVLVAALRTSIAAQALERVRTEGTSNDSPAPV